MNTTLLRRAVIVAVPLGLVAAGCGASVAQDTRAAGGGVVWTGRPA